MPQPQATPDPITTALQAVVTARTAWAADQTALTAIETALQSGTAPSIPAAQQIAADAQMYIGALQAVYQLCANRIAALQTVSGVMQGIVTNSQNATAISQAVGQIP